MNLDSLFSLKFSGDIFYFFIFIFGSCIGSFLNVVIYRLPIMLKNIAYNDAVDFIENSVNVQKITDKFNLSYPPSHCPRCKNNIPSWANVPILGFFFTRMRCHYCHLPISFRYPLIETITALLFLSASIIMPNILAMGLAFIYISISVSLGLISYDKNHLPKSLSITLLWLGLLANTQNLFTSMLSQSIIGAVLGFILGILLSSIFHNKYKYSLKSIYLILQDNMDIGILASIIGAWFGYIKILEDLVVVFIIYALTYKISKPKLGSFYLSILMSLAALLSIFV